MSDDYYVEYVDDDQKERNATFAAQNLQNLQSYFVSACILESWIYLCQQLRVSHSIHQCPCWSNTLQFLTLPLKFQIIHHISHITYYFSFPASQSSLNTTGPYPWSRFDSSNGTVDTSSPSKFGIASINTAHVYSILYGLVLVGMGILVGMFFSRLLSPKTETPPAISNHNMDSSAAPLRSSANSGAEGARANDDSISSSEHDKAQSLISELA